jgi:mono/diheme cytochrome c family protein
MRSSVNVLALSMVGALTFASPAGAGIAASDPTPSADRGAIIYMANCSRCHQANGRGVAGSFPPLAGNPSVTGDPERVIHVVKYGLSGQISVDGKSYMGLMPASQSRLSDADIAAVVTYIRSSWGNSGTGVTAAQVRAVAR